MYTINSVETVLWQFQMTIKFKLQRRRRRQTLDAARKKFQKQRSHLLRISAEYDRTFHWRSRSLGLGLFQLTRFVALGRAPLSGQTCHVQWPFCTPCLPVLTSCTQSRHHSIQLWTNDCKTTGCFKKVAPPQICWNIFTLVKSFCVKFCKLVCNSYPHISTNFCRYIYQSINQTRQFLTRRNTAKPLQGRDRTRPPRPTLWESH